jgi:hypothetical protein
MDIFIGNKNNILAKFDFIQQLYLTIGAKYKQDYENENEHNNEHNNEYNNENENIFDIPDSVKKLDIVVYTKYSGNITHLPKNLQMLSIWHNFTSYLPHVFPNTLIEIDLTECEYNNPLNNLPEQLEILRLGTKFNQSIKNLPSRLKQLYIKSHFFNQSIDMLPIGLEYLEMKIYLQEYEYNFEYNNLPNLKTLIVQFPSLPSREFDANNLPDSIEYLELDCKHFPNVVKLPINIKKFIHYGCKCKNIHN